MKALLLIGAAALLAVGATTSPKVKTPDPFAAEIADLIESVKDSDGQYTKVTEIKLKDSVQADATAYFHAGAFSLKRTTFYDETVDALLMCNTDGPRFGGDHPINSGYGKVESDMKHFSLSADGQANVDRYFDPQYWVSDYTVPNTTPSAYFVMLSSLAAEVRDGDYTWNKVGDVYTYDFSSDPLEFDGQGNYKNELLHKVQFFAAPLLLQSIKVNDEVSHYITPSKISVEGTTSAQLIIKLYVSSSDSDKVDNNELVLAEATVTPDVLPA